MEPDFKAIYHEMINHFGGNSDAHRAMLKCGFTGTRHTVLSWAQRGISPKWVMLLSAMTGIAPERLRPDIFGPLPDDLAKLVNAYLSTRAG